MPVILIVMLLFLPVAGLAADVLVHNANGYADSEHQFTWMTIRDGRVSGIGSGEVPQTEYSSVVDMQGKTVMPGLIDAHGHVLGLGQSRTRVDLVGSDSLQNALARVAEQVPPGNGWILGRGWNQVLWPVKKFPSAADLDRVMADRPVWLRRIDGHAGWANTRALEIAGIENTTANPVGGKILRDADGNATGVFVDAAMALIEQHIATPDENEIRYALGVAQNELNSLGITSVHDAGVDTKTLAVYKQMADKGQLSVRVYAMISGAGENLDAIGKPLLSYGDGRFTARSVKLYIDGALGSRGAALISDYCDEPGSKGLLFSSQEELDKMVSKAMGMGFQVGIHAIGDLGNHMALNAFEKAQQGESVAYRNRIEHAQIVALDDIPRFASLGVIAAMQPVHATSDKNMAADRVGKKRLAGGYAWRKFLDSGTVIAAGSDFPVEYANPFHGIYAAVTRMDQAGEPPGGWYPGERMTLPEAVRAFTIDAAWAGFQENDLGDLKPGKWADFIVLDRDLFNADESELWQIQVEETWLAGERVFVRQ
ncbi:MAG: amidohydrolase [Gammaproteobacteria bacterium]|nr:amidohydrolase [Gammaproteobacteria bacterium]